MLPPQMASLANGGEPVRITPVRVVARVKIPPATVFELMQALSQNERLYEENIGPIPRPGGPDADPPLYPPGS